MGEDTAGTGMLNFPNILKFLWLVLYPDTHVNVHNVDLPLQISKALSMVKRAAYSVVLSEEPARCYIGVTLLMRVGWNSLGCVQIV